MRAGLFFVLCVSACTTDAAKDSSADTDTPASDTDGDLNATTYHRDVLPILDARCGACHTAGGQGPFDVHYVPEDWQDGPPAWVSAAVAAVESGTMPPWPPDQDCFPMKEVRSVPAAELDILRAWRADGYREGSPVPAVLATANPVDTLGTPDLVYRPDDSYAPDPATPDDYRCLVVDASVEKDAWITAITVAPDQQRILHHVILFAMEPSWADDVATWDAEAPGPGYPCFGSPGTWEAETLVGWAPGQQPESYGDGVARHLKKGSVLVLQVHYNTLGLEPSDIPADRSTVQMWTLPDGEKPTLEVISLPLANTELDIPAGNPSFLAETTVSLEMLSGIRRTIGVFPHMHKLGTSIRLDAVHADKSEQCMVNIPSWEFAWQQAYFFDPEQKLLINRNDKLRLRCTYDNSAANQLVVNGVKREPQDVTWGEGTSDEMCLVYLYVTLPVSED